MFLGVPSIHSHILFHRHGYGLDLSYQFPNYREDPNTCNSYGTTPLHVLCLDNYGTEIAEELIVSGAQVNAKNHFGCTPLHFAVIHRHQWMVDMLIEHGADVNLQDKNGNTALHFAVRNSKTLLYLPEYQTGDLWIVQRLLKEGAFIDITNKDNETPLMWAVLEDNLDIVKELLAFGANVNIRKIGMETCLHVASKKVKLNKDILIELVKNGACVSCLDENGKTPLDVFLDSRNPYHGFKWAKELIKIAALVNFEHETDFQVKGFLILNDFIHKCSEEVSKMKSIKYTDKLSLCDFALNRKSNDMPERNFDRIFDIVLNCTFPIYLDFIVTNFKRSYLCQKLLKVNIYTKSKKDNVKTILNHDVTSFISGFLSDWDLFNFIKAYSKPTVSTKI